MEKLLSNTSKKQNHGVVYLWSYSSVELISASDDKNKCKSILGLNLKCKFIAGLSINKS